MTGAFQLPWLEFRERPRILPEFILGVTFTTIVQDLSFASIGNDPILTPLLSPVPVLDVLILLLAKETPFKSVP